ncbi:dnajc21 [Symbiodinium necroappetens]|uniref:Dnajc21 protein n=1 Tax=Symbiodinium necroappetens TaxID=1628268 RepID=A0A812YJU4_9DINO|nr:dnajc21 [Symbiodinium necroappetens]
MELSSWRESEEECLEVTTQSSAPLAEKIATGTSMPARLMAVHQLLEKFLHQPSSCADLCQKLVVPLLDLAVEAERLPHLPVKLLRCLASVEVGSGALEECIPTILGILRGTEDPLLTGASLQLLLELGRLKSAALRSQFCNSRAGLAQLLLRCLFRWACQAPNLEITISLLRLFKLAACIPCHRNMLKAEVAAAGVALTLPQVLEAVADGAARRAQAESDERSGWETVHEESSHLAREWEGIGRCLELPPAVGKSGEP